MSEPERILSREECTEHDLFWMSDGREHVWTCRLCGYARDAGLLEVRAEITCLTPTAGMPDALWRGWMPVFPLEYV
jgi:hypothetical protein